MHTLVLYEYECFKVNIVRKLNGMKLKIIFYLFLLLSSARFQAASEQQCCVGTSILDGEITRVYRHANSFCFVYLIYVFIQQISLKRNAIGIWKHRTML